ncbi:hypothetical protein B0T21DRAFT_283696 [Apiosordaria backusii]|uniref:Uncharacterized protein n=1 Tax=Apiosordaria backusii TaxID=314023 RepID=A0AA40K164_9PEZI|nr:hypothetical protein B0T21DRAFT_283696 [Apiosordaria backusii]
MHSTQATTSERGRARLPSLAQATGTWDEEVDHHINGHINGQAAEANGKSEVRLKAPKKSHSYDCSRPQPPSLRSGGQRAPSYRANSYVAAVQSLDPRPLEQLHNERSYLIYNLQKQGQRATRLFQKYAALEVLMSGTQTPAEAKKTKREMSSIKNKISESTQQEQLILIRLGELHIELQNRDRWMQVHQPLPPQLLPIMQQYPPIVAATTAGVHYHPQGQYYDETPVTATAPSFSPGEEYYYEQDDVYEDDPGHPAALDPMSPCFTPAVQFSEDIWSRSLRPSSGDQLAEEIGPTASLPESHHPVPPSETAESDIPGQSTAIQQEELESTPETDNDAPIPSAGIRVTTTTVTRTEEEEEEAESSAEGEVVNVNNSTWATEEVDSEPEDVNAWKSKLKRLSHHAVPLALRARDKRMSLPSLKDLWPRSRKNSLVD